jgi:3-oxoacyl-[acyl-carrier-protein] synthase III
VRTILHGIRITDVLGVVPTHASRFDDEITNYRQDPASSEKLKTVMGYDTHRLALEGTTVSALAAHGIRHLADLDRLASSEIGALVLVTQTPDYPLPATSSVLHGLLGLDESTYCVDVNDGCNGFVKGLHLAASIMVSSDLHCAVLVTGDVLSQRTSPFDRNSFPLIGDAVAITVLRKDSLAPPLRFDLRNNGTGYDRIMIPAGGSAEPASPETMERKVDEEGNARSRTELVMLGRDVFTFTQTVVPRFLEEFLAWSELPAATLGRLYLHQANAFIVDRLRKRFKLDDTRAPDTVIRTYGNSSSATIPMSIAADKAPRTGPSVACGFGVGLAWGAVELDLSHLGSSDIIEFGEHDV